MCSQMQQFVPMYYDPSQPPLQPAFHQLTAPVPQVTPQWQGDWEEKEESGPEVSQWTVPPPRTIDPNSLSSSPQKVKHRRRTTPEQLRVLEHWFNVNPKPDNNMREWLAMELGMTKRNIQVWFQNRRAKVKNLALKEAQSDLRTPPKSAPAELGDFRPPISHLHTYPGQSFLSPPGMGRRVSLAEGEAQKMQMVFQYPTPAPSVKSRKSMPYSIPENAPASISPVGRPSLHLAAIHNSRRASVPSAHTVTSGPFTPPRFGDKPYEDLSTTYISTPSTYVTPAQFAPNAPLPSPGFSFGSHAPDLLFDPPGPWNWAPRGRLGSVASQNTFTTEGSSDWETIPEGLPEGFNPDSRRASAPAELLQQLGVLGLQPNIHLGTLGPVAESPNPGSSSSPHCLTPFGQRRHSTSPTPASPNQRLYEQPMYYREPFATSAPDYSGQFDLGCDKNKVMTAEQFFVDLGSIDPAVMQR